jgi:hypothetical protein
MIKSAQLDNSPASSQKLKALASKAKYQTPKVISFPMKLTEASPASLSGNVGCVDAPPSLAGNIGRVDALPSIARNS